VFGGIDPSSGTACMMEIAKALGKKYKQGNSNKRMCRFGNSTTIFVS